MFNVLLGNLDLGYPSHLWSGLHAVSCLQAVGLFLSPEAAKPQIR